jgi:hypothetical protein
MDRTKNKAVNYPATIRADDDEEAKYRPDECTVHDEGPDTDARFCGSFNKRYGPASREITRRNAAPRE